MNGAIRRSLLAALMVYAAAPPAYAANTDEQPSSGAPAPQFYVGDSLPAPIPYRAPRADPPGTYTQMALPEITVPKTGGFTVDLQSRQHSRAFFNSIYSVAEGIEIGFSGDVSTCLPGDTDAVFRDAVLLRVNYFREMAGVPDNVVFNPAHSAKAQSAALMMASAGMLSHSPGPTWPCYSTAGAEGAANSNLSLGNSGARAVASQMYDNGSSNGAVGHRRWILHPPTQEMGTGDVYDASSGRQANALWVFDMPNIGQSVATRDGFVAWPPPGHVPYPVVPVRWSFGVPGADFSNAGVSVSRGGVIVPVTVEAVYTGYGINTLVWHPTAMDPSYSLARWPQPAGDTTYRVALQHVVVGGVSTDYAYEVRVFDPAIPDTAEIQTTVQGPAQISVGLSADYSFTTIPFAEGYTLREADLAPYIDVEGAETGLGAVTDGTDADYPLISSSVQAVGNASFHLAHPNARTQYFVLEREILASSTAELAFSSRLGWATADQVARVQVSSDEGVSWADVYTQAGTGGSGEAMFTRRTVPLGGYAGKAIKIRFLYGFEGGSYYPQTSDGVGFYVDEIQVTGAEELTAINTRDLGAADGFGFTPQSLGRHLLQIRYFGWQGFPGSEWGSAFIVEAVDASDFDGDGLSDVLDPDDDNDGLPDTWETSYGLNPFDQSDASTDLDEDGLNNAGEYANGTRPDQKDTDRDGASDGEEVADGYDPLDAANAPDWVFGRGLWWNAILQREQTSN